ncbi:APC family permease [Brevibacillus massiliensis]|uniref:APC family permease n=1 Tax=Brevibacillus massiliensis TaxID=1118054 RepID=UPI00030E45AB|nr:APC family permease [Brevibacillus massiliensis]
MQQNQSGFIRTLSRFDVLALAFGAIIGWGWVVLSSDWILSAGSIGAMLAFLIGGIIVFFVGLTYAELTSAMPKVGGEHEYTLRAMGIRASFVTSWAIALGYISVVAFEAVALPTVTEYLFPNYQVGYMWTIAGWDVYFSWVVVGMAGSVFIAWLNYIGVKPAAVFQLICTVLILVAGGLLFAGSAVGGNPANLQPLFVGGFSGIAGVLMVTPFMFVGFDVIPQAAEEINIPAKQVGKLLLASVIMGIVFYIAVIFGVANGLDKAALEKSNLASADAMQTVFNSALFGKILILGGIGGILTSWNAFFIGGSRILYAMAESGMLPSWLGRLHPKYKTPSNAILFIGILSFLAPLFGRKMLVWLSDAGSFNIVITYLMVSLAFVILRKKAPDMPRPFCAGKSSAVGVIAVVLSFFLAVLYLPGMPAALVWPYEWVMAIVWWVIGVILMMRLPNTPAHTRATIPADSE